MLIYNLQLLSETLSKNEYTYKMKNGQRSGLSGPYTGKWEPCLGYSKTWNMLYRILILQNSYANQYYRITFVLQKHIFNYLEMLEPF
jgi:hypothetical protein